MGEIVKCKGSGTQQMVDWSPDDKASAHDGKPYPGASVCIHCSYGVMLVRGSVHEATSEAGFEGQAGTLRVHYVERLLRDNRLTGDQKGECVQMAYRKGDIK